MPVYHVELRNFPNVARAFNLDRESLDSRFLRPWVNGELIEYEDRRWPPEKTRLKVLEADAMIHPSEMGLGRGWSAAAKRATDVTETLLAQVRRGADARPEVESLKDAIEAVAATPITFVDVITMAVAAQSLWRASEQLGLAEQAVWELLHQGRVQLLSGQAPVERERWQAIVLSFATWSGDSPEPIRLRRP